MMNLADVNTESSLRFHRSHEHLNRTIKITAIGLILLEKALSDGLTREELDRLSHDNGGLWGGMPDWTNPSHLVTEARTDLGHSGLIRAFSAMDRFLVETDADLERWEASQKSAAGANARRAPSKESGREGDSLPVRQEEEEEEEEDADKILRYYERHGWSTASIDWFYPVYRYYRLCRNCIAHRAGIVSAALERASQRAKWEKIVEKWVKTTGEKTAPPLVELIAGSVLRLSHRDALLASSLLRRMVLDMGALSIAELGPEGMVYLAAYRVLMTNPPQLTTNATTSAAAAVHDILGRRYHVTELTLQETIGIMRSLGIWDKCRKAFDKLRGKG